MEWHDLLADGYERVLESLDNVLHGLSEDDLNWQPSHDCNSIGWLAWHLTRQQDAQISEQVAAFKSPDVQTLLDYHRAVLERSKRYFLSLTKNDLDRELDEPRFQPLPTVGVRLVSIMDDAVIHAGQAAYVRGLRQGKGWQKY